MKKTTSFLAVVCVCIGGSGGRGWLPSTMINRLAGTDPEPPRLSPSPVIEVQGSRWLRRLYKRWRARGLESPAEVGCRARGHAPARHNRVGGSRASARGRLRAGDARFPPTRDGFQRKHWAVRALRTLARGSARPPWGLGERTLRAHHPLGGT